MKIKKMCFRACQKPVFAECSEDCENCEFALYKEVEFEVPKFIERKIKKYEAMRQKQSLLYTQVCAFCHRKGYQVADFVGVWQTIAGAEDEKK